MRNRYNQAPRLTQDTNGKVTASQLDITNESQEVSPFPAGGDKASINRRARKHNKNKTEITQKLNIHIRGSKTFCQRGSNVDSVFPPFLLGSKYCFKRDIIGLPSKHHINGVSLACR